MAWGLPKVGVSSAPKILALVSAAALVETPFVGQNHQ